MKTIFMSYNYIILIYDLHLSAKFLALLRPIELTSWAICLCILLISIVSLSTKPKRPIPLVAKYNADGQPRPPHPIINTLFDFNFIWPIYYL